MPRTSHRVAPSLLTAALLFLGACAPGTRGAPALTPLPAPETEELGEGPDLDEAEITIVKRDLLGSVAYDLPLEANTWVESELDYLVEQRPAVIRRWLERGDFYEGHIKQVLAENGLPTDLFHLAMIESGFVPTARSRAGAVGLWQFMPATGRMEGLRVDSLVDERMDPVRSTRAAARHLRTLHRSFGGDWALAAAAYNAGSGRISRGLRGFVVSNFWDLAVHGDLADETKHYVPRLYAMTIIGRDRERFGFQAAPENRRSFAYDSMQVDFPTPLSELALMGNASADELAQLNPHLLRRTTPPGTYWVWVPSGTGAFLQEAYLASEFRKNQGYGTYSVRKGDTLSRIASASGVSSSRIRELNRGVNFDKLQVGQKVRLPAVAARQLAGRPEEAKPTTVAANSAAAPANRAAAAKPTASVNGSAQNGSGQNGFKEHTVKQGESLWAIARQHGVSVEEVQKANKLSGAVIVPGRKLRIPVEGTRTAAATPAAPAQKKSEVSKVAEHVVKVGETLWSIARDHGSSVSAIQVANRIDDSVIVPGQKLVIPR